MKSYMDSLTLVNQLTDSSKSLLPRNWWRFIIRSRVRFYPIKFNYTYMYTFYERAEKCCLYVSFFSFFLFFFFFFLVQVATDRDHGLSASSCMSTFNRCPSPFLSHWHASLSFLPFLLCSSRYVVLLLAVYFSIFLYLSFASLSLSLSLSLFGHLMTIEAFRTVIEQATYNSYRTITVFGGSIWTIHGKSSCSSMSFFCFFFFFFFSL